MSTTILHDTFSVNTVIPDDAYLFWCIIILAVMLSLLLWFITYEPVITYEARTPREKDVLGDRVKKWEAETETKLDPERFIVIRLDGRSFRQFTRSFDYPVDQHLQESLIRTTEDLVKEFNATTGYCQRDEITLVLPRIKNEKTGKYVESMFGNRLQKLVSISASFATARYNHHLCSLSSDVDHLTEKFKKMNSGRAHFDSRVLSVETDQDVRDIVWWRYRWDCFDNGISCIGYHEFPKKSSDNMSTNEKIRRLVAEHYDGDKQRLFDAYPSHLFYGTFIKRRQYEKTVSDFRTGKPINVLRSEFVRISCPSSSFSSIHFPSWLLSKFLQKE